MPWEVEFTDEFESWWLTLDVHEQDSVDVVVGLLEERGPSLSFPHSSKILGGRNPNLRELRVQHRGSPYRILYAFDPRRVALLLLGGSKAGDDGWYEKQVPKADRLYDEHVEELRKERPNGS